MFDPCTDCIVSVNCSQICPARKNYVTLCSDAIKYYTPRHRSYSHIMSNANQKEYAKARKRLYEALERNKVITNRNKNENTSSPSSNFTWEL